MIKKIVLTLMLFFVATNCYAASKYWVGGGSTANWTATGNTNWSNTDGGANNATVPANGDDVFMKSSANCVVTLGIGLLRSFNMTGYTGTLSGTTGTISVVGQVNTTQVCTLGGTITWSGTNSYLRIYPMGATTTFNFTTNGKTIPNLYVGTTSSAGTVSLQDALTVTGVIQFASGVFNTNGNDITAAGIVSNFTNTRTFTLGDSVVTLNGTGVSGVVWDFGTTTGLTLTANAATINCTYTGSTGIKYFKGGGATYAAVSLSGFASGIAGSWSVTGSNTYGVLTLYPATVDYPNDIVFPADSTQTVNSLSATGTSSRNIHIESTTGASGFTMADADGGTNENDYLDVTDCTASPEDTFYYGENGSGTRATNWGEAPDAPPASSAFQIIVMGD